MATRQTFLLVAAAMFLASLPGCSQHETTSVADLRLPAAPSGPEPAYNGKKLSQWLIEYRDYGMWDMRAFDASHAPPSENDEAAAAVRHIGTNALPWLLYWTFQKEGPGAWVPGGVGGNEIQRRNIGLTGFEILGTLATPAIPLLVRLEEASSPSIRTNSRSAMTSIGAVGMDALPALLAILADPQRTRLVSVAHKIVWIPGVGTNARPAIPPLLAALKSHDDLSTSLQAAQGLGHVEIDPEVIVPALTESLQDSRPRVRAMAALSLARQGQRARSATPALLKVLGDPERDVRFCVTNALSRIAPEVLEPTAKAETSQPPTEPPK